MPEMDGSEFCQDSTRGQESRGSALRNHERGERPRHHAQDARAGGRRVSGQTVQYRSTGCHPRKSSFPIIFDSCSRKGNVSTPNAASCWQVSPAWPWPSKPATSTPLGHSESVAGLVAGMAVRMGFSPEEVERIKITGRLHDLGKIGIRDDILLNTNPVLSRTRNTRSSSGTPPSERRF